MRQATTTNRLASDLDNILERTEPLWQELRGQRILITGATGFFGAGCWKALPGRTTAASQRGRRCFVAPSADAQRKGASSRERSAITLHSADVCRTISQGCILPRHPRRHRSQRRSEPRRPLAMFDTVVTGTRRCLQFAASNSVRKLLFVSSGAVYERSRPNSLT